MLFKDMLTYGVFKAHPQIIWHRCGLHIRIHDHEAACTRTGIHKFAIEENIA